MKSSRIASIDVLRAITMFLMVFVNDLWTVQGVPAWLEHAPASADAMGFSDIIFPGFLFIVGLSLPIAVEHRLSRGQPKPEIFRHVLLRSLALIVMGFFHVNLENYGGGALVPKPYWEIAITIAFFLIWLDFKREQLRRWKMPMQLTGIAILIFSAMIYSGKSAEGVVWMRPQWWGILGLIGWAYLLCAGLFLITGERLRMLAGLMVLLFLFNCFSALGWLKFASPVTRFGFLDFGNASNATLVMSGVVASVYYRKYPGQFFKTLRFLIVFTIAAVVIGLLTRPLWGISKIRATPSWVAITAGISSLAFAGFIYLADWRGKQNWFRVLKPAGTSTLTCYLLPYLYYPVFISLIGWRLPEILRTGAIGIIKCLLFALLMVLITGWLEKARIRLKI